MNPNRINVLYPCLVQRRVVTYSWVRFPKYEFLGIIYFPGGIRFGVPCSCTTALTGPQGCKSLSHETTKLSPMCFSWSIGDSDARGSIPEGSHDFFMYFFFHTWSFSDHRPPLVDANK